MSDAQQQHPAGEYAIVELFGHTTLVGRIAEVERFGSKMLAIEPIFCGEFLPAIFHGGAAIYRLTPCSAAIAFERAPSELWALPPTIKAIVPPALLPPQRAYSPETDPYRPRDEQVTDDDIVF